MTRSCGFFVLNKVVMIKIKTFLYTMGSKKGIIRIRKTRIDDVSYDAK